MQQQMVTMAPQQRLPLLYILQRLTLDNRDKQSQFASHHRNLIFLVNHYQSDHTELSQITAAILKNLLCGNSTELVLRVLTNKVKLADTTASAPSKHNKEKIFINAIADIFKHSPNTGKKHTSIEIISREITRLINSESAALESESAASLLCGQHRDSAAIISDSFIKTIQKYADDRQEVLMAAYMTYIFRGKTRRIAQPVISRLSEILVSDDPTAKQEAERSLTIMIPTLFDSLTYGTADNQIATLTFLIRLCLRAEFKRIITQKKDLLDPLLSRLISSLKDTCVSLTFMAAQGLAILAPNEPDTPDTPDTPGITQEIIDTLFIQLDHDVLNVRLNTMKCFMSLTRHSNLNRRLILLDYPNLLKGVLIDLKEMYHNTCYREEVINILRDFTKSASISEEFTQERDQVQRYLAGELGSFLTIDDSKRVWSHRQAKAHAVVNAPDDTKPSKRGAA